MGNLTAILSNHSLNTQSLAVLAKQLSEKLHASVAYGYCNNLEVPALQWSGDYSFVEQGVVVFYDATETLFLSDYYYWHRELLQNHSHKMKDWFKSDEYLIKEIEESNDCVTFELCKNDAFNVMFSIHQHVLEIDYLDFIDWRNFTRFFSYEAIEESIQNIQKWRKEHQEYITNLGGSEMIVYEDLAETFYEMARFKTTTFEQLKEEAIKEHSDNYCNISDFFINKKYIGLPKYDDSPLTIEDFKRLQNDLPLERNNNEKYFGVFFDDFRGINDKKVI
jgi:hypothetical protein